MSERAEGGRAIHPRSGDQRVQALYWTELVQLKVDCEYVRRYRDSLTATMTRFAMVRAVVSVSALGTWAAVKSYPFLWGGIIAAAQVADAVQGVIPFAARARGCAAFVVALDALFIDCEMEWQDVFTGRLDEAEITQRRHKMKRIRLDADQRNLPNGLPVRRRLFRLAETDADAYFKARYDTGAAP